MRTISKFDGSLSLQHQRHKRHHKVKQCGGDPSYGLFQRPVESFDISREAETNPEPAGVEEDDGDPTGQACRNRDRNASEHLSSYRMRDSHLQRAISTEAKH